VKLGSFNELAHIEAQRRSADLAKKVPPLCGAFMGRAELEPATYGL
jgi:hypothetical protein